jgi:hypothetical protein
MYPPLGLLDDYTEEFKNKDAEFTKNQAQELANG